MDSIIKFGQHVQYLRKKKGLTQRELSLRVFNSQNYSYIGMLERGTLNGITFTTADKIMMALNCELDFKEFKTFVPDYV